MEIYKLAPTRSFCASTTTFSVAMEPILRVLRFSLFIIFPLVHQTHLFITNVIKS